MTMNSRFVIAFAAMVVVSLLGYSQYAFKNYEKRKPIYPQAGRLLFSLEEQKLVPVCENALVNMTRGRWVRKVDLMKYKDKINEVILEEERLVTDLQEYWVKNGVQSAFWSQGSQCGYTIYQTQPPDSEWPKVGSWCNPNSERPCCSNNLTGTCMAPSEDTCNCPGCVDVRKYKHAETSDWIVEDGRCKWLNYDASQICDVIERSPFSDIQFVGDSFARKMFRTLSVMITDDFENGWTTARTSNDLRNRCKGMQTYYWKHCRVTFGDIRKVYNPKRLCGGRGYLNFTMKYHCYYNIASKTKFLDMVKSKLNVHGSLIVLSVGFHMRCNSTTVINKFLGPAIDEISNYYDSPTTRTNQTKHSGRWPQIVLCLPPTIGLLKPPRSLAQQSQSKCDKYSSDMKMYAKNHDISILDFRPISRFIHSFDGTHYSFAVNKLKNVILLNYIASLEKLQPV